jgi:hypothetical protein
MVLAREGVWLDMEFTVRGDTVGAHDHENGELLDWRLCGLKDWPG